MANVPEHADFAEAVTEVIRKAPTNAAPPRAESGGWPRAVGYEVLSVIGAGGMGIVLKARHRELRRVVALKTLRTEACADPEFLSRFQAEAEAVARLQHPNIIQLFEIGEFDREVGEVRPTPFIALEFVDGGCLAERTGKPTSPNVAALWVEKLARALDAAHRVGVIHRDVKPANVLLTRDGEPKLADFGLAKQFDDERDSSGRFLTQAGAVMGTPEYMAPEQAAGAAPRPAIDIYALGVILYELLTARVPFQGATPVETMTFLQIQEPVSPRRLQPAVSRDLETICLKCLEKDPDKRYATGEDLANDLQALREHRPIQARRAGEWERFLRWRKRNPLAAASLLGTIGVFLAAFALVSWSYFRAETARENEAKLRRDAERNEAAERRERYRADVMAAGSALQVHNVSSARRMLDASPEPLRDWEWRHFASRLDVSSSSIPMRDPVLLSRSPNGATHAYHRLGNLLVEHDLVTGEVRRSAAELGEVGWRNSSAARIVPGIDKNRAVVLWDFRKQKAIRPLPAGEKPAVNTILSGDARRLATGSDDGDLVVWDVASGTRISRAATGTNLHWMQFSPDGTRLLIAPQTHLMIQLYDADRGVKIADVMTEMSGIQLGDFSPSGAHFAVADSFPSTTVHVFDSATGKRVASYSGHANAASAIAYAPGEQMVATTSRDQTVAVWRLDGKAEPKVLRGHVGGVRGAAFSPDGKRLATVAEDHTLRVWDPLTGVAVAAFHGHSGHVIDVAYERGGQRIVTASGDGTFRIWDSLHAERDALRGHKSFIYGVAVHPDGRRAASASWDGTFRIWDLDRASTLHVLDPGNKAFATSVAFHPEGKILASLSRAEVRLWDVDTGRTIRSWPNKNDGWHDTRLAYDAKGKRIAAGSAGGILRIWDASTGVQLLEMKQPGPIRDVAFSPDDRYLVFGLLGSVPIARVWDLERNVEAACLQDAGFVVQSVAFSRDGKQLAFGTGEAKAFIYHTSDWSRRTRIDIGAIAHGLTFSADGARLAGSCADNVIRLWDTTTGLEVCELHGHVDYAHQSAFSPDGTRLVSGSGDGTLRVWDTLRPIDRTKLAQGR